MVFFKKICTMCVYINTEYWPEHSFIALLKTTSQSKLGSQTSNKFT